MAIKIKFDNEQRALPPTLVLATRSGHKLGCIPAQHIVFHGSLANGYELSCSVSKYDNWEKIDLWDTLEDFKLAWSPEWDVWFELDVTTNEADDTVKNITATSIGEAELSQVMLYNIEINTETDIAREDYKPTIIYNPNDHTASLLDRIMEKTPHYKIRHVDSSIAKLQRTFAFDGKSLRDALLEICKEVNALLIIHSGTDANGKIERAYSIYDLEEHCTHCGYRGEQVNGHCPECGRAEWSFGYGDDTGIFVSRENLADDITYETAKDSVKNCFRLVAGDDLMTAAVAAANPNGTPYLWYISDKVREDMSPALRNRLKEYDDLYKATQDSSFSFTSAAIRNYNALAAKYGRNQIGTVEKFAGVLDAYYDTIDFELHLEHGLLPDVNPPLTSAADELRKLIANLSPVSVRSLSTLSSTTASSYVTQAARSIIDPRYSVTTQNETLNGNLWSGSFIITRYSDEEDTATSAVISVSLDENYENYIRRQIERVLNTTEFEDLDIVELFKKSGTAFASAIKQYSLAMLKSFYDACQACLNVLVEHNSANESIWAEIYHDLYEPYYAKLGYLQAEISLRESEIGTIQMAQAEIESVITSTQKKLDFEKFMGGELWLEFAAYRREDTYQNDNYISDGLDNAALVENARDFLKTAQEDIERSATLQHSISANLSNLLVMEEFQGMTDNFELGNWLRIRVDDTVYILRLIDYEIDFDNLETLTVEYSDVVISPSSVNDIKSVLNSANSMASSYGSVSRQAKHGDNSQRQLDNWVTEGLEATKVRFLSDAQNQNIIWDENGMLFRKWDDITESYEPTQLRIINSTIAVTDDNWKTVKTAVGGFDYKDPVTGEVKHGYGINAELLIGKLILGEELGLYNANNSLTFDRNGLTITNGDNSFMVSPDGTNLFVVECGEGNKVMWVDENGGLHLRPTSFELSSGQTIQDITDDALEKFKETIFDPAYEDLVDSKIETWYQSTDPRTDPASHWQNEGESSAEADKRHIGDIWYDSDAADGNGMSYMWDGSNWKETRTKPPEGLVDKWDGKKVVFYYVPPEHPTPPYDLNDLWVQGESGEIKRCQNAKAAGESYAETDWGKADGYADDAAIRNFINDELTAIQTQVDSKIETWYQSTDPRTDPASHWQNEGESSAEADKRHIGDIWYDTSDGSCERWDGGHWTEVTTKPPQAVFDRIDGKAQIFVGENAPATPYHEGDLWFKSESDPIYVSTNDRLSGACVLSDWVKKDQYIDSSDVGDIIDNTLTQEDVFNRLTGGGKNEGIYLENGHLYVNASYIKSGTLSADFISGGHISADLIQGGHISADLIQGGHISADLIQGGHVSADIIQGGTLILGGSGNMFGSLLVKDPWGNTIGEWNMGGISITRGSLDSSLITGNVLATAYWQIGSLGLQYDHSGNYGESGWSNVLTQNYAFPYENVIDAYLGRVHCLQRVLTVGGYYTSSYTAGWFLQSQSALYAELGVLGASSSRYKDIDRELVRDELNDLYDIPVVWAKYKDGYLAEADERCGKEMPMFIAEDIEKVFPLAVDHLSDGQPENWNYRIMIPIMFQMIKDQKSQLDELKSELAELKKGN